MKWFFALNQSSREFAQYADMAKVAVFTAQERTSLEPHCIYDGDECEFTSWLTRRNVPIIPCRSRFYDQLSAIARERETPQALTIGAGAFLRAEIPTLCRKLGISDPYVLYTDCDVMFQCDVATELSAPSPKYFSVAPETVPDDYIDMNTGVMLMNVASLASEDTAFTAYVQKYLPRLSQHSFGSTWDQGAYRLYYHPLRRFIVSLGPNERTAYRFCKHLRRIGPPQWDCLARELNWKPYWGDLSVARIVHFHGAKPLDSRTLPIIRQFAVADYDQACREWKEALVAAGS